MAFGAVAALARTGRWIVDRGTIDGGRLADTPDDLSAEEIARLTAKTAAPVARVRHLKPVVQMDETPPAWARPPVPLGHGAPAWPPRS